MIHLNSMQVLAVSCKKLCERTVILDDIGDHFMDLAVKKVQEGDTFVYVLDNID